MKYRSPLSLFRRAVARCIIDRCVPRGIVPRHGPAARFFRWATTNRDVNLGVRHPLHRLVALPGWDTTFALSRGSLAWLWNHLHAARPRRILEMGSGRSTAMLALFARQQAAQGRAAPTVVSIDHDPEWLDRTAGLLAEFNAREFVRLVLLPLGRGPGGRRGGYRVDLPELRELLGGGAADFLLIDGPPGSCGRAETLPSVLPLLAEGADVFLDDAFREQERRALEDWAEECGGRLRTRGILPLGPGLAWLKVKAEESTRAAASLGPAVGESCKP